ncbi:MAG TPA: multicopper oxidase domain-containing protein, partial [Gammaproteobacteria bacterium]|nr:multicopper oxidase domain-containing protein [Gammaproteobacteria bacterium]
DSGSMGGDMADSHEDWVLAGRAIKHGPNKHGAGAAMVAMNPQYRMDDPGVGLQDVGHRVLVYDDLRARRSYPDRRDPGREIELHLTGNMERYMWSFDGERFSDTDGPILFHHGERLRLILVNDTMMDHPIHLHGMWMELENRHGRLRPRKHTVIVKPGEMLSARITADAPGYWFFHCHLLYHMHAGMARVVHVG